MKLTLHGHPFSANAHRAKMFLELLRLPYREEFVDLPRGAHKTASFLQLNISGRVPVLQDDQVTIFDSHAIVIYLAEKYGEESWWPSDPVEKAQVSQWMFFDSNEIHNGIGYARNHIAFNAPTDLETAQRRGREALDVIEKRLAAREWLELDRPTLADISCYPLIALAPEANIALESYPNVHAWLGRIENLPGALPMPRLKRQ